MTGERLGSYEVLAKLGEGGMGAVYRAHDPRLGRDVAIKVILASFATDVDRVRRFEQEARAAAALTHPNILAVHDVGVHQSSPYLVSELLHGTTLRERMTAGPLPVRKAVEIAVQIARGLAAAHHKNIVHRDLKPENVFITDDDLAKILDFGLAKLVEAGPRPAGDASTRQAVTEPGSVMGTAGYMSPEQLRAQPVDARSDIFAFGAVLYELLAGNRAFRGETTMDVATAILKENPPDFPVERRIPPALARIVERCLEKNPAARFQSAGDLAFALEALSSPSGTTAMLPATVEPAPRRSPPWLGAAGAGVLLGIAATSGVVSFLRPTPPAAEAVSFSLTLPDGIALVAGTGGGASPSPIAVSPDGRHVAVLASGPGTDRMIWVRSRSDVTARRIAGTEGASSPFWSPDSREIAFLTVNKLRRVSIEGGPPADICEAPRMLGGSWSPQGMIILGVNAAGQGIQRVPAAGGTPEQITKPDVGLHSRPVFLPDGRHFVFRHLVGGNPRGWVYLGSLDSPELTRLVETDSSNTAYSAGHLLYLRGAALMAHPFDAVRRVLAGDPFQIADGVQAYGGIPNGVFSASENGVVAYQPGSVASGTELRWFARASGAREGRLGEAGVLSDLRMTRDGTRVAYSRRATPSDPADIWIADTTTLISSRFTFDAGDELSAAFSHDGSTVAFSSDKSGTFDLYRKAADGTGSAELLLADEYAKFPIDWSADGHLLYLRAVQGPPSQVRGTRPPVPTAVPPAAGAARSGNQLWVLPPKSGAKPFQLIDDGMLHTPGSFSPNGRFVTYQGNDGERPQIFVTTFPSTGAKWQISTDGGAIPKWSADGTEIFYMSRGGSLMAARVDATGPAIKPLGIKELFQVSPLGARGQFAPSTDGTRFLVNTNPETEARAPALPVVVIDWPAARRAR